MPRVLVTGANGFVGTTLVRHLARSGREPIALVREGTASLPARGVAGDDLPVEVRTWREWSIRELAGTLRGVDAVVHAASIVHRRGLPDAAYEAFNVDGTRALVRASVEAGVRKLVFLSSVKVYGEAPRGDVDEDTPARPAAAYAETKLRAERIVLDDAPSPCVLRLAPVYGRGDKGNVRTMIRAARRRLLFLPGTGATRKSLVHASTVADVTSAIVDADALGVFVVADVHAPTMRELATTIARALDRPPPRRIPAPVLRLVARAIDATAWPARALGREPPRLADLVDKSLSDTTFRPDRVVRTLGVACHVDLERTIADEIAWLRDEGAL